MWILVLCACTVQCRTYRRDRKQAIYAIHIIVQTYLVPVLYWLWKAKYNKNKFPRSWPFTDKNICEWFMCLFTGKNKEMRALRHWSTINFTGISENSRGRFSQFIDSNCIQLSKYLPPQNKPADDKEHCAMRCSEFDTDI